MQQHSRSSNSSSRRGEEQGDTPHREIRVPMQQVYHHTKLGGPVGASKLLGRLLKGPPLGGQ